MIQIMGCTGVEEAAELGRVIINQMTSNSWLQTKTVLVTAEMYVVKAEGLSAEATVKDFQELFPTVKEVRLPIAQAGEKR